MARGKREEIDPRRYLVRRLLSAFGFLCLVVLIGTVVYHQLGRGEWGLVDCLYMTVITIASVGFGEVLPGFDAVPGARLFTIGLIILGSGTVVYFVSTLTAFIVEGDLLGVLRGNRMQKRIDQLGNHIIVCGGGATGVHVLQELEAVGDSFVVVDRDESRLVKLGEEIEGELLYVVGDATDDHVLEQAGVERARGLIAAVHDDKDNLFVTMSARALNPKVRIIAKAVEQSAEAKMRRAGADAVVSPNRIGGMRMVSEMIRPVVVKFLDEMLRDREHNLRVEEITLPASCAVVGAKLRDTAIREATDALVIALRTPEGSFLYNPSPNHVLTEGMTLVVLAHALDAKRLRSGIEDGSIGLRSSGVSLTSRAENAEKA